MGGYEYLVIPNTVDIHLALLSEGGLRGSSVL